MSVYGLLSKRKYNTNSHFIDSIMGTKQSHGIIIKQNKNKHKSGVAKVLKTTEPGSRDVDKICVEYI